MSATEFLRKEHEQIRRLDKVIIKCYNDLYAGNPYRLMIFNA